MSRQTVEELVEHDVVVELHELLEETSGVTAGRFKLPVDVGALVEQCGYTIAATSSRDKEGIDEDHKAFLIYSGQSVEQKRHATARLLMRHLRTEGPSDDRERRMADMLLMPESGVIFLWEQGHTSKQLQQWFGVDRHALVRRVEALGLQAR